MAEVTSGQVKSARGARPVPGAAGFVDELISHLPRLRAFACSLARTHAAGEDLAQEAVLQAWRGREGYTPGTNMEAWLFRILRNQHISGLRQAKRRPMLAMSLEVETVAGADDPSARVDLDDLRRAMKGLPVEQRDAVALIGIGGWSYEKAAAHARCPLGTMKSRVFRARRTLEATIEVGRPIHDGDPPEAVILALTAMAETARRNFGLNADSTSP